MNSKLSIVKELLDKYYSSTDPFEQTDIAMDIIEYHLNWLIDMAGKNDKLYKENSDLSDKLDKCIETLSFYAENDNYTPFGDDIDYTEDFIHEVDADLGWRAEETLKSIINKKS